MANPFRCSKGHVWPIGATVPLCCPVCGESLSNLPSGTVALDAVFPVEPSREATIDLADGVPSQQPQGSPTHLLPEQDEPTMQRESIATDPALRTGAWDSNDGDPVTAHQNDLSNAATGVFDSQIGTRPAPGDMPQKREFEPVQIPGYEILAELGRGAMGVVYKARQIKLNRIVALKMILSGTRSSEKERIRFQVEAEAVARIRHPNIVQVYEIGEANRSPFFSLEFIDGGDLADRIMENPIPPLESAHIVEQLAHGMDCAHRNGVIHRDLKPANVLLQKAETRNSKSENQHPNTQVNPNSGQRKKRGSEFGFTPKITDFGLAKKLDDDSTKTRVGAIMGTPSYMAPEQAEGRSDIGPPCDIYALGAILYDCLTGRPPFQGTTLLETLEQVKGVEPMPVRHLRPGVPKDLETICLKCLQKEPQKRYASAGDLAEDLRRFRNNEPISARPVSVWERGAKWCRRRPAAAALVMLSGLIIVLTVILGIVYVEQQQHQAREEKRLREEADRERDEAARQRQLAVEKREEAEKQRRRAEKNFERAQQAVDLMLTRIGQERLQYEPRMESVRRDLLVEALRFYDEFLKEKSSDPVIRFETGKAMKKVADIRRLLGAYGPAEKTYRSALELFAGLVRDDPDNLEYRREKAATLNMLGNLLVDSGKRPEAEKTYAEAAQEYQRVVAQQARPQDRAELATIGHNRARVLHALGRIEEAEQQLGEALDLQTQLVRENEAIVDRRRELARSFGLRGELHMARKRLAKASEAHKEALALYRNLAAKVGTPADRQELALTHQRIGNVLEPTAPKEAEKEYREAIRLGERLTTDFPLIPEYRRELGASHIHLGIVLLSLGQRELADQSLKRGLALKEKLAADYPHQPDHRSDLALSLNFHAAAMLTAGRFAESIASYGRAVEVLRDLAANFADNHHHATQHAQALLNLAVAQQQSGSPMPAEKTFREALQLCEQLAERFKDEPGRIYDLARARWLLATLLQMTGKLKDAEPLHRLAQEKLAELARNHEGEPDYAETLAACLNNLGDLLRATERATEGMDLWREASAVLARLVKRFPERPGYLREQARTLHNLGVVQAGLNMLDDAETSHKVALALRQRLVQEHGKESAYRMELASSHNEYAVVLARLGRHQRSEESFREAIRQVRAVSDKPEQWQAELNYQTNLATLMNLLGKKDKELECQKRVTELKTKLKQ